MKKLFCLIAPAIAAALVSCGTQRQITYFQDTVESETLLSAKTEPIRLQPDDKISVVVNCQDVKVANLFNLPYVARYIGQVESYGGSYSQGVSGYTVQSDGSIDFPLVGKITVAGLTREECAARVKEELTGRSLVKDPVVTVEFMNLCISVLGEVTQPGRIVIQQDRITLLDALSLAGDLTIYGRRDNIRVIRREDGRQRTYVVDITDAAALMASPAFSLRQNDLVYVEPNLVRQRQATVNGNNIRSTSFWISLASLLTSVTLMVFNLTR